MCFLLDMFFSIMGIVFFLFRVGFGFCSVFGRLGMCLFCIVFWWLGVKERKYCDLGFSELVYCCWWGVGFRFGMGGEVVSV